jgi:histidinol phosphatase-like enzyme
MGYLVQADSGLHHESRRGEDCEKPESPGAKRLADGEVRFGDFQWCRHLANWFTTFAFSCFIG